MKFPYFFQNESLCTSCLSHTNIGEMVFTTNKSARTGCSQALSKASAVVPEALSKGAPVPVPEALSKGAPLPVPEALSKAGTLPVPPVAVLPPVSWIKGKRETGNPCLKNWEYTCFFWGEEMGKNGFCF